MFTRVCSHVRMCMYGCLCMETGDQPQIAFLPSHYFLRESLSLGPGSPDLAKTVAGKQDVPTSLHARLFT